MLYVDLGVWRVLDFFNAVVVELVWVLAVGDCEELEAVGKEKVNYILKFVEQKMERNPFRGSVGGSVPYALSGLSLDMVSQEKRCAVYSLIWTLCELVGYITSLRPVRTYSIRRGHLPIDAQMCDLRGCCRLLDAGGSRGDEFRSRSVQSGFGSLLQVSVVIFIAALFFKIIFQVLIRRSNEEFDSRHHVLVVDVCFFHQTTVACFSYCDHVFNRRLLGALHIIST